MRSNGLRYILIFSVLGILVLAMRLISPENAVGAGGRCHCDTAIVIVVISSPSQGDVFNVPCDIEIKGKVYMDERPLPDRIEFYEGNNKIGVDYSSPYSYKWTNVPAGNYTLTTRSFYGNDSRNSSPVGISVYAPNNLPSVSITSPSEGSVYNDPANVLITASASDTDDGIAKVEFFNGSTKIGEDTSSPYECNWVGVTAGSYVLTAKATDERNGTSVSTAVNIVVNENPHVWVTYPGNGATSTMPVDITVSADAVDNDGSITKVEFYEGSNKLGEDSASPYQYLWAGIPAGDYSITAKAYDDRGASRTSAVVFISVYAVTSNNPPDVTLTSPSDNATYSFPSSITINATASDTDGSVSKVEFYAGATKIGEDTASPYSYTWNDAARGTHTLAVKAVDNEGATKFSSAVNVTVRTDGYYITGRITDYVGGGLSDTEVILSGDASGVAVTDSTGYFEFLGLAAGSYRVTPSRSETIFTPEYRDVDLTSDRSNQTFASRSTSIGIYNVIALTYNNWVEINWHTSLPSTSRVEYGLTDSYSNTSEMDINLVTNHTVRLENLAVDTEYHYRVICSTLPGCVSVYSADYEFRTSNYSKEILEKESFNVPNPCSTVTDFHYTLNDDVDDVSVNIFTLSGKPVRIIPGDGIFVGQNTIQWDLKDVSGKDVPNGLYLYRLVVRKGYVLDEVRKACVMVIR